MISDKEHYEKINTNVPGIGEFRIKNSAHAFSILSSGLYSNKIKAIIRELSTNALDSHVAAKNSDPFEVHLPSILEPWFHVRDFGTGLDHDNVVNIYTTYFESTKSDSNDFIGALGLGSKSPFSYTGNFTVTAIKNGTKRIYSAYINEQGVPSIALMDESSTSEKNGVEVKFAVLNKNDYYYFRQEAMEVFSWFKLHPKILGEYRKKEIQYKEQDIIPGVHLRNEYTSAVAIMGNIAYPLSTLPDAEKHLGANHVYLNCPLVINFEIGDLDFTASREDLSYIPRTINSIKKKLEELVSKLEIFVTSHIDNIPNEWNKAVKLKSFYNEALFSAVVKKYITDKKFKLLELNGQYTSFKYFDNDLSIKKGIKISGFSTYYGKNKTTKFEYDRWDSTIHSYRISLDIPVTDSVVFVLNDLKIGANSRARYHYSNMNFHGNVVIVDTDLNEKDTVYKDFLKELHNPPTVVYASALDKKERAPITSTSGILKLQVNDFSRAFSLTWKSISAFPANANEICYYVTLKNYEAYRLENGIEVFYDLNDVIRGIYTSGIKDLKDITIYGVRKNRMKDIKDLKNWVNLSQKIESEVSKITEREVQNMTAGSIFKQYEYNGYLNKNLANKLPDNSAFSIFYKKYASYVANESLDKLVKLCKNYGKNFEVEKIKTDILADIDKIKHLYPMIKYALRDDSILTDVVNYITLIDKNLENTNG